VANPTPPSVARSHLSGIWLLGAALNEAFSHLDGKQQHACLMLFNKAKPTTEEN
jgi:hypothetical protein